MTKQYDIISLNNHLYMVDKESLKEGDWVIVGNITAPNHRVEKLTSEILESAQKLQELMNSDKFPAKEKVKNVRILASTDTTLGLPLLPKVEEDDLLRDLLDRFRLAHSRSRNDISDTAYQWVVEEVEKVYKAASVKKEIISVEVEVENNKLKLNDNQVIVRSWIFRTFV